MHLLDINVWLGLAFLSHVHHAPARRWFEALATDRRCYFCRFTQHGFLRLANSLSAFPQAAFTQDEAWKSYDSMLADPRVEFANEPPTLEAGWRQFTQLRQYSPKLWADAYLAAFAIAGGYELVTFDKGFKHPPALNLTILS